MNKSIIEFAEVKKSDLGKKIGQGMCSEVFAWEKSRVCKLFYESIPRISFDTEFIAGRAAMSAGIPVPSVHGAVQIEKRLGIIFDRINGRNLNIELARRFWKIRDYMKGYADLQIRYHQIKAPEKLISQFELLEGWINRDTLLPAQIRETAMKVLGQLTVGKQLCHGDYHFGNVIVGNDGPVIIDWQTANAGNPLGDMAASEIVLAIPVVPAPFFRMVLPFQKRWAALYRQYCEKHPWYNDEEYGRWLFVVAAARMGNIQHSPKAARYLLNLLELMRIS